eukprot:gene25835-biopygen9253
MSRGGVFANTLLDLGLVMLTTVNRTCLSDLLAIKAAEHLLNLVPPYVLSKAPSI